MLKCVVPLCLTLLSSLLGARAAAATPPTEKRIVFLGDSITQAGGYIQIIEAAMIAHHPEDKYTIIPLGLASETASGLSEPGHAGGAFPRPTVHERLGRVLEKAAPQLVLACYGMNDGIYHPLSPDRTRAFQDGIQKLHDRVTHSGSKIIHLTPPVFDPLPIKAHLLPAGLETYPQPYEGYNTVLDAYSAWLLTQRATGWEVLDIHSPMNDALAARRQTEPEFTFAPDGVHANDSGHVLMATVVLKAWGLPVTADGTPDHPQGPAILAAVRKKQALLGPAWLSHAGHLRPGLAPGLPLAEAEAQAEVFDQEARRLATLKPLDLPGKTSEWNGFRRHDFEIDGRPVTVIAPATPAPGKPWVWHGEFFGHRPAPDIALLHRGFHVVSMQLSDMLGCPTAVTAWNLCHRELTTHYGFHMKPALVGLSRGGLYCYNWAIANPDKVSCLYADAAVCDFKSWPGGKGKGKGDAGNWASNCGTSPTKPPPSPTREIPSIHWPHSLAIGSRSSTSSAMLMTWCHGKKIPGSSPPATKPSVAPSP
jgi:lysophospholipase L1-like esterase